MMRLTRKKARLVLLRSSNAQTRVDGQDADFFGCDLCRKAYNIAYMARWNWLNVCDEHLEFARKIQALSLVADVLPRA